GGLPVLSQGTPLVLPADSGIIQVGVDGSVSAGGNLVGRLDVARFDDPGRLIPAGTTQFAAPPDVQRQEGTSFVLQGYRESSNVQPAAEMVCMIRSARYSEAAQRALRALSDSVQLNTRPS